MFKVKSSLACVNTAVKTLTASLFFNVDLISFSERRETKSSSFHQQGNGELCFGIQFHPQFWSSVLVSVTGSALYIMLNCPKITQVCFRLCIVGKAYDLFGPDMGLLILCLKHSLNIRPIQRYMDILVKSSLIVVMFLVQNQGSRIHNSCDFGPFLCLQASCVMSVCLHFSCYRALSGINFTGVWMQ